MKNHVIEPNSEILILGKVHNGNMQDGKVMLVKRTSTAYYTTGALVCNTIAKPVDGQIPLRILNATSEEITLWKGTVIGIAEPVRKTQNFLRV